jgi:hypothetical protein
MKKNIIVLLVILLSLKSFGQATLSKQDYLKKSKTQNTIATYLLGTGIITVLTGVFIAKGQGFNSGTSDNSPAVILKSGLILSAGSIPFYIMGAANKRKAKVLSAGIKMDVVPQVQQRSFFPSLSIKISL